MSNWNPDSQITSLRFNAILVGAAAIYFCVHIAHKMLATMSPEHWFITSNWLHIFSFIWAVMYLGIAVRWSWINKKTNGCWREMLGLYKDEFTLQAYRKACVFSLSVVIAAQMFGLILGAYSRGSLLDEALSLGIVSMIFLTLTGFAFSLSIWWQLRESDNE